MNDVEKVPIDEKNNVQIFFACDKILCSRIASEVRKNAQENG